MDDRELMTAQQVAKLLNVSIRTLRGLVKKEQIPHIRMLPHTVRFDPVDIEVFLDSHKKGKE